MLHHPTELLIALAALLFVAATVRLVAGNPRAARHRVRILRWRIRLYLRPGAGYANILELAVRWSRPRAVRIGRGRRDQLGAAGQCRRVIVITPGQLKNLRSRYGSAGNKDDRFDRGPDNPRRSVPVAVTVPASAYLACA